MTISAYLKEIGRGKEGARSLDRNQACDLMDMLLLGEVGQVELGAFWMAMRIKGESAQEMAGFLDSAQDWLRRERPMFSRRPVVVIPSYNGARKLPGLTALLACLLARVGARQASEGDEPGRGFSVLVHGSQSEAKRISSQEVLRPVFSNFYNTKLHISPYEPAGKATELIASEKPYFFHTWEFFRELDDLLQLRRRIGVRSSVHSLVKLLQPIQHPEKRTPSLLVTSYTHPEYLHSMTETLQLTQGNAMLLRGTEGESVADARRRPRMDGFVNGRLQTLCAAHEGSLHSLPELPASCEAAEVASYTCAVLRGEKPVPAPIAAQLEHILHLLKLMEKTQENGVTQ